MKEGNIENFRFDLLTGAARRFSLLKKIPLLPIIADEQVKWMTFFFKPSVFFIMSSITSEVKSWENVSTTYHQFGGLQFNVYGKEMGHLHGNGLLDVRVPKKLRKGISELSFVENHHILNQTNWVSIKLRKDTSTNHITLFLKQVYREMIIESRSTPKI